MARHRMQPPIHSIKHFVARTNTSLAVGARIGLLIAHAVVSPAVTLTTDVNEGSVIKALWIDMWCSAKGATNTDTQVVITLEKIPALATAATFGQMLSLQAYPNKRNILFTFQGVLSAQIDGAQPISPLRGWVKIPKGKQRMALDDKWVLNIATVGQNVQTCGMFIFKEYK